MEKNLKKSLFFLCECIKDSKTICDERSTHNIFISSGLCQYLSNVLKIQIYYKNETKLLTIKGITQPYREGPICVLRMNGLEHIKNCLNQGVFQAGTFKDLITNVSYIMYDIRDHPLIEDYVKVLMSPKDCFILEYQNKITRDHQNNPKMLRKIKKSAQHHHIMKGNSQKFLCIDQKSSDIIFNKLNCNFLLTNDQIQPYFDMLCLIITSLPVELIDICIAYMIPLKIKETKK